MGPRRDGREPLDAPPVPWMHGAAGITGGAISMAVFYPLDFLRTRLHTQDGTQRTKLRGWREVLQQDGVRGMYKGVGTAVCAHSVGWGLYLTSFRSVQHRVRDYRGQDSASGDFFSACLAATCTATAVTPLNVLKTRVQLSDVAGVKTSGRDALRTILKQEGWRSLFRGAGPQILLSSHTTIQVAMYECIKRRMWEGQGEVPLAGVAIASALSKCVAAVFCNPLEVCRTRLQDQRNLGKELRYSSMTEAFRTIWVAEGVRGMYRGIGVNCMRVVPTTVLAFVIYEKLLCAMHSVRETKRRTKQVLPPPPQLHAPRELQQA